MSASSVPKPHHASSVAPEAQKDLSVEGVSKSSDSVSQRVGNAHTEIQGIIELDSGETSTALRSLWKQLVESEQSNDDLTSVMSSALRFQEEAGKKVLAQNPGISELFSVMTYVPKLRDEAGRQLLAQHPSNSDLCYMIRNFPRLREEAYTQLLTQSPSTDNLLSIRPSLLS
ncbi:hypothetical protein A2881_00530 [Candidatus Peribacteria bacterium RIFCSPHIGHO2_01_FULL_55_13]|nr:MAG: hypothetical protein A2881_00530 [Candidatus Peribacteria bacterium RIFCSPHIGHO2_01_FULL_55_13]OGJ66181.1 MAG: hypothetical protein A3F36_05745 [Candidatus Peribacteria bacterium RIFCSPHIGHO2_12_FULL_55_11]